MPCSSEHSEEAELSKENEVWVTAGNYRGACVPCCAADPMLQCVEWRRDTWEVWSALVDNLTRGGTDENTIASPPSNITHFLN